ncbi:MAG TPA: hypothetical protein VFH38_03240 [Jatrophihabitans sp.]|nr:hypothetical protein [Jatrophihabitans sp.]
MRFLPRGRRARADAHLEAALRATLTEHARHAPAADVLAERILAAVDAPPPARDLYGRPPARPRAWRSWATPLVAAASVAAVAGAVVGVAHLTAGTPRPVAAPPPPQSSPVQHSGDRVFSTLGHPHARSRSRPSPRSSYASPPPSASVAAGLRGVRVLDLTFTGTDDGWALASADCLYRTGRCTAVLRTRDGTHWSGMPGAAFNVPGVQHCAAPCVTHLRFADDRVGYAFGPSTMFMTTDGGRSWQRQPGGALALETLDGNVIRVVAKGTGCPGPCHVQVETAAIGSTVWSLAQLPPNGPPGSGWFGAGVQFARGVGGDAYLLLQGNPAGGAGRATSQLLRSTDAGRTWSTVGEPCPQSGAEVDSYQLAAGGGGRVSALCATRQVPQRWFVATSTDAGAHFAGQPGTIPPAAAGGLLNGDPATVLISAGRRIARSTDGGRTWTLVARPAGPFTFLGFENAQVGRAVTRRGNAIWTTRDGGLSWTRSAAFG